MTLLSFLIAFGHFSSEILIFRTAKLPGPVLSTVIVSSASRLLCPQSSLELIDCHTLPAHVRASPCTRAAVSLFWMIRQYDFYVKA